MQRARKRYNLKSKIVKKKFTTTLKRYNPKLTSTDSELPSRLELALYVQCVNGTANIVNTANQTYWGLAGELVSCYSWLALSPDYFRYKITGLSVRATPVADGSDIGGGLSNYPIHIGFYPNFSGQTVSSNDVLAKDDSLRIEPNITIPQQKYWKFPDKYFEASGSGFGIWTPTSAANSQVGQLSLGSNPVFQNFGKTKLLYMLRVCFYVKFSTRKV